MARPSGRSYTAVRQSPHGSGLMWCSRGIWAAVIVESQVGRAARPSGHLRQGAVGQCGRQGGPALAGDPLLDDAAGLAVALLLGVDGPGAASRGRKQVCAGMRSIRSQLGDGAAQGRPAAGYKRKGLSAGWRCLAGNVSIMCCHQQHAAGTPASQCCGSDCRCCGKVQQCGCSTQLHLPDRQVGLLGSAGSRRAQFE